MSFYLGETVKTPVTAIKTGDRVVHSDLPDGLIEVTGAARNDSRVVLAFETGESVNYEVGEMVYRAECA